MVFFDRAPWFVLHFLGQDNLKSQYIHRLFLTESGHFFRRPILHPSFDFDFPRLPTLLPVRSQVWEVWKRCPVPGPHPLAALQHRASRPHLHCFLMSSFSLRLFLCRKPDLILPQEHHSLWSAPVQMALFVVVLGSLVGLFCGPPTASPFGHRCAISPV